MFEAVEDYIRRPIEERKAHLDLTAPCMQIGGYGSLEYRGLLAHALRTTIPKGKRIHLCHACHTGDCSNFKHLYWGTPKENAKDRIASGICVRSSKFDDPEFRAKAVENGRRGGRLGGGLNKLSIAQKDVYRKALEGIEKRRGWKNALARQLGISHTHVKRLHQMYIKGDL